MDTHRPVPKARGLHRVDWEVLPWSQDHGGPSPTAHPHTQAKKGEEDILAQTPVALCIVLGSAPVPCPLSPSAYELQVTCTHTLTLPVTLSRRKGLSPGLVSQPSCPPGELHPSQTRQPKLSTLPGPLSGKP